MRILISRCTMMMFANFLSLLVTTYANNIALTHVTHINGPTVGSYFGYSVAAQKQNDVTVWIGAPKYSVAGESPGSSPTKHGAIYRCKAIGGISSPFRCSVVDLEQSVHSDAQGEETQDQLPAMALESCDFGANGFCGFTHDNNSDFHWQITMGSGQRNKFINRNKRRKCFKNLNPGVRLTGPMDYTINDYYLNADSKVTKNAYSKKTILVSQPIAMKKGLVQCLRFCFNAYSELDRQKIENANRSLIVWMKDLDTGKEKRLFKYNGLRQFASEYWNHTELNITGKSNGFYKLYFKAVVYKYRGTRLPRKCYGFGDVVLADINVSNIPCGVEDKNVDVIEAEQSIGLNLAGRGTSDNVMSLTTCAPLWQHNCGYAREANGACYEVEANDTHVRAIHKHNPIQQECIRGKIDIVLLVDQSGSVNQCNFQKVKRWLRDIVRSFNLGLTEQDVGVVVYSSKLMTRKVIDLGFGEYHEDGRSKKAAMTRILTNLPYEAGKTYTGYAFKIANEMLTGNKSRSDAKKMIILLTDGATTRDNTPMLEKQLVIARSSNISILAVGVGKFNETELVQIAGDRRNFFAVKKFSELEKVRDKLRSSVSIGSLEGSHTNESMENLQQCQLGFSIHYNKEDLYMGSPGCYGGVGNVITHHMDITPSYRNFSQVFNSSHHLHHEDVLHHNTSGESPNTVHAKTVIFGEFDVPTISQLKHALTDNLQQSYLGYAVTSGNFFGPNAGSFVASSAPRFHGNGAVVIYHSLVDPATRGRHYVVGQQFSEYFGATLCSEDVNADGFDDLMIGAPLYSTQYGDVGRVYVYMGGSTMAKNPSFVLKGSEVPFSRFGSTISAVGDLNLDGFQDIVISATLEEQGTIYIYHGCHAGISTKPAQRITPNMLNILPGSKPFMFGQSITGKIDFDNNGYHDLLVGSPGNDSVMILLTRPVVHISVDIRTSGQIDPRTPCAGRTGSYGCFICDLCFSFTGVSIDSDIVLKYVLVADPERDRQRFLFSSNNMEYVASTVLVSKQPQFSCTNYSLYMKPSSRDLMNPANLTLHYDLVPSHNHSTPDDAHHTNQSAASHEKLESFENFEIQLPRHDASDISSGISPWNESSILTFTNKTRKSKKGPFLNPILDMYRSQDVIKLVPFKTFCEKTQCSTDLSMTSTLVDQNGNPTSTLDIKYRTAAKLQIKLVNTGLEDAYDVTTVITFPQQLVFMSFQSVHKTKDDIAPCFELKKTSTDSSKKSTSFNIRNPVFSPGESCEAYALFDITSKLDPHIDASMHFTIEANTISVDANTTNNVEHLDVTLRYIGGLSLSGYSQPYTIYVETNDSHFPQDSFETLRRNDPHSVSHQFTVRNTKFFTFHNLLLTIKWPAYLFMNGSRFMMLYITDITCTASQQATCVCDSSNFTDVFQIFSNDTKADHPPHEAVKMPGGNILHQRLPCRNDLCYITLPCHVTNLLPFSNASVVIHSIAYPNTMIRLKSSMSIEAHASVSLLGSHFLVLQRKGIGYTQITTENDISPVVSYSAKTDESEIFVLPYWVYIVSAAAGLLLVFLIVLILKMTGFFESKYADKKRAAEEEQQWGEAAAPLKT